MVVKPANLAQDPLGEFTKNLDGRIIRLDKEETTGATTKIFIFLDSPFSLKYTDPQVASSILDWSSVADSVMYKNKEQW